MNSAVYDYFTPIENAIAAAFQRNGVDCYTPLGEQQLNESSESEPSNTAAFQKKRPRVEVVLMPGANKGILRAEDGRRVAAGYLREWARTSSLVLAVITEADIIQHRAYLAKILYLLDTLAYDVSGTETLQNHAIQSIKCLGGSIAYKSEEGNYQTTLNNELEFSVQTTAWALLETEP